MPRFPRVITPVPAPARQPLDIPLQASQTRLSPTPPTPRTSKPLIDTLAARTSPLVALLVTLALTPPSSVAGQDFTLRDVLSASMPTGLLAARDADFIAWVTSHEGSWNVWVAHGPDYQGRQLTDYGGDDGQAISGLTLTPDGASRLGGGGGQDRF